MIKVCHFTSVHPKEDIRIYRKECVSLKNAGYDVYLVQQGESYEKDGIHIVGFGEPASSRIQRILHTGRAAYEKALEVNADVYHFHDPELLPYALKLKKKGKKVIFDSHERYTEQLKIKPYLPKWIAKTLAVVYGSYENHVLRKIDGVIFPCTIQGKNPFEGLCKRTAIVSNAAILGDFYDKYVPDFPKVDRQVCCPGSLTESRGITATIVSSSKAGARLVLAGEYSPREYQNEVEKLPEYACVDYRGRVSKEQVAEIIQSSHVGISTELNYGQYWIVDILSTKVVEFMSMGIPVVLNCSDYNKSVIDKYKCGLYADPENTDEVADAIRYLLEHPDEAKQMGENGRAAVKNELNWSIEEKKLLALYDDILNEG